MIKKDCANYDLGDTAPSEYGAFCSLKKESISENSCDNCKYYLSNEPREELMVCTCGNSKNEICAELQGYKITKIFIKCPKCRKKSLIAHMNGDLRDFD